MEGQGERLWANLRTVREIFGISGHKLTEFVSNGWVRGAKLGETKQSNRLYNVQDISRALECIARGHKPGRRPYKPTRRVRRH
jgi:hypothetical protein